MEQLINNIIRDTDGLTDIDNETYLQEVLVKFIDLGIQRHSPIEFLFELAKALRKNSYYKQAAKILTDILEKKSYTLKSQTETGIEIDQIYAKAHYKLACIYFDAYDEALNNSDSEQDSSDEELNNNQVTETLAFHELILDHWELAINYNGKVATKTKERLANFINKWNENTQDSDTEDGYTEINKHNFEMSYLPSGTRLRLEIDKEKDDLIKKNKVLEQDICRLKEDLETCNNGTISNKLVHLDSKDSYFKRYFIPPQQQEDKLASIYQKHRLLQKQKEKIQRKIDKIDSIQKTVSTPIPATSIYSQQILINTFCRPLQNVKREPLHDETQIKTWLKIKNIPEFIQLGAACGKGDCFFDTVAQGLNQLEGKVTHNIKYLRVLCYQYANRPNNTWVKSAVNHDERDKDNKKESYEQYLTRIGYTAEEMAQYEREGTLGKSETAVWGRPNIEGRIFCEEYDIQLHVIEIHENDKIVEYLVDANGERDEIDLNIAYNDSRILHIVNYDNHYVPLLDTTKLNLSQQSMIQFNEHPHKISLLQSEHSFFSASNKRKDITASDDEVNSNVSSKIYKKQ